MKREVTVLLKKATDSLFLSIDHFNRPYDRGRHEAVLIFLDRAFELLLKGAILHRGGRIREKSVSATIGLDRCVRKCITDVKLKCLSEEDAFCVQNVNSLRDAAQHYWLSLSEDHLYLHAQAGLTLFSRLIRDVFGQELSAFFPDRVLPITTRPPRDLADIIEAEFADIRAMCQPGRRRRIDAEAKLRGLAIIEKSVHGDATQLADKELRSSVKSVVAGKPWRELFPGIATLRLDVEGHGFDVCLRITKREGEPIQLVKEGTPGATVVGVRRVNELDYYSLGCRDIAQKLGVSQHRVLQDMKALKLQDDIGALRRMTRLA